MGQKKIQDPNDYPDGDVTVNSIPSLLSIQEVSILECMIFNC